MKGTTIIVVIYGVKILINLEHLPGSALKKCESVEY